MTRRKIILMTAGATVLGLAALVGFAGQNVIFADDDEDEDREALIKLLDTSKINLQQGRPANSRVSRSRPNSRSTTASSSFRSTPRRKASFSRC